MREQISSEMWEQLNRLFHAVQPQRRRRSIWDARDFLQAIKDGAHLFQGITDSTMTHGEGWQFIQAGRSLERAWPLSTLVGRAFPRVSSARARRAPNAHLEWIGLLRSCTAFEAYCKAYTADLQPDRIAEFLVLNPSFPHSIRFSADALETAHEGDRPRKSGSRRSARVERIAGRLRATLGFGQIDEIMTGGLHAYLRDRPAAVRPGPQRAVSDLHHVSDRGGAGGLATMFYSIRHLTRFRYKTPVSESLMEVRMHPRTEGAQRCLSFQLSVDPRTRVYEYRDYLGNMVHHFDVPGQHRELTIVAEALVEIAAASGACPNRLGAAAWDELDRAGRPPAITGRC